MPVSKDEYMKIVMENLPNEIDQHRVIEVISN